MWENDVIDLGVVDERTSHNVEFIMRNNGEVSDFTFKKPCSCTGVTWNNDTHRLAVRISINEVPRHIPSDTQEISKAITASYTHKGVHHDDVLVIKAVVKKV